MAILTALFGFLGRFAGKALTTTLGWASVLLFGRIPEGRQVRFAALTFGSLVWVATLVGVIFPDAGTILIGFVPLPDWVDRALVRLVMLGVAIVLPAILGAVAISVADPADRPHGGAIVGGLLRGYLITPVLAIALVVLAVAGVIRKARAAMARRETGHVAIVVRPGQYEALVQQLEGALRPAGLIDHRTGGSRALTLTAGALARVAGAGIRKMVPDQLAVLKGREVELEVYPSDLSIAGTRLGLARARAALLRELDSRNCWFTTEATAQEIEDTLARVDQSPASWDPAAIATVDHRLATEAIDDDEWDVLYRRRLQVAADATGTNLAAGAIDGAAGDPNPAGPNAAGQGRAGANPAGANPAGPNAIGLPNAAGAGPAGARPSLATLVGLVTAGLVMADIALLATRRDARSQDRRRVLLEVRRGEDGRSPLRR